MSGCICGDCPNKCYEYENNSTSDKAYYEWAYKEDKCKTEVRNKYGNNTK